MIKKIRFSIKITSAKHGLVVTPELFLSDQMIEQIESILKDENVQIIFTGIEKIESKTTELL